MWILPHPLLAAKVGSRRRSVDQFLRFQISDLKFKIDRFKIDMDIRIPVFKFEKYNFLRPSQKTFFDTNLHSYLQVCILRFVFFMTILFQSKKNPTKNGRTKGLDAGRSQIFKI
jgi:hypothetical protein